MGEREPLARCDVEIFKASHTARDRLLRKREDVACEGTPEDFGAEVCHHKVCDNFFTGYDNSCLQFEKAFQTLDKVCQTLDL